MGLSDFAVARQSVPFRNGTLDLRGLSLDDVAVLMNTYLADIDKVFDLIGSQDDDAMKAISTAQFAINMARDAPALVAHIIALAADEPSQISKARQLPLPVQVECIKVIIKMTFEEAGGAKNFFASLGNLTAALAPASGRTDSNT